MYHLHATRGHDDVDARHEFLRFLYRRLLDHLHQSLGHVVFSQRLVDHVHGERGAMAGVGVRSDDDGVLRF